MADAILSGNPISWFPNGYPIFICIVKVFFRESLISTVIIFSNVVFSTLVVFMTMEIFKKISGNKRISLLSGFVVAVYPNQINYVRQMLSDVPATFFLILGFFLWTRGKFLRSGFFFYIAGLFRSTLLPIGLIIFFVSLLKNYSIQSEIKTKRLLAGFFLAVGFYSILIFANIVKPSGNLSYNISKAISFYNKGDLEITKTTRQEDMNAPIGRYFQFALEHPALFIRYRLLAFQDLWGWPVKSERSFLTDFLISLRFPLVILALIGFIRRYNDLNFQIFFIPILLITIIHVTMFSSARFTYTVEPLAIILGMSLLCKKPTFTTVPD
ncbi:MAG: phospholipid carrier-dependent glycosyltransferase [Candidatus Riflebacteria bacterium]|nr:phospholipid carrier-dependent glycosyltransferase [Candidatus Riflebacteria bacterium]